MRLVSSFAVGALALLAAAPAFAAQYSFDFSGPTIFGSPSVLEGNGIFTTSDIAMQVNGQTAFAITDISGMLNGSAINGLQAGFLGSNNLYFTTGPSFVDGSGVGFTNAAGASASLYYQSTGSYRVTTVNPFATAFVTASSALVAPAAVPEPASWAMMLGGFGLVGSAMRRRRSAVRFV